MQVFLIILILHTRRCSGLVEKEKKVPGVWLEMFLGLYFLLKRVNACRIKFMKKMTKFTGLIIFSHARRALLPSSLL